jgi:hypothetical protein
MGELSIFNLEDFITTNNCINYVETGTGMGVCLRHIMNYNLKNYYSIDLDGDLIGQARRNFPQENIEFIHNYSSEALKDLLPSLPKEEPILFFLDAHFPGADFGKMSYEQSIREFKSEAFPLLNEIKVIKQHRDISKDCFIIDDWKLYDKTKNYEMGGWDYEDLQAELNLTTNGDIILNEFKNTHNYEIKLRHQGFAFITPNNKTK